MASSDAGDSTHDFHDACEDHAELVPDPNDAFHSPDHSPCSSEPCSPSTSQEDDDPGNLTSSEPRVNAAPRQDEPGETSGRAEEPSEHSDELGSEASDVASADDSGGHELQHGPEDAPICEPGSQEYQDKLAAADLHKSAGNAHFKEGRHEDALDEYAAALASAPQGAVECSVFHANSAACHMAQREYGACVASCNAALLLDAQYAKALRRRMAAYEALDQLDQALIDAKQVLELSPTDAAVAANVRKWEPIVAQRQEAMKEEVMGKLKDLGNNLLGNFGMSLDNFKMVQDPQTGGYSFNFQR